MSAVESPGHELIADIMSAEADTPRRESNWVLFWTFLKIGSTAFGGFMALISVVQSYLVDRKKLLSHAEMLDGISLATILPGPVAVNLVAYAGFRINGVAGAAVCTSAVIIPSFLLVLLLSYLYFTWGEIPAVNNIFKGFIPAVAAIIIAAAWNMGKKSLNTVTDYAIALIALLALVLAGGLYSTLLIIVAAGLAGVLLFKAKPGIAGKGSKSKKGRKGGKSKSAKSSTFPKPLLAFGVLPIVAALVPLYSTGAAIIAELFIVFAGMSVLLFGGGFVFIPMIQETVVNAYGWVSNKEFIDGIAIGQVTPGPILISATFIGYKVAGVLGAGAATIGIFLPPAILMLVSSHFLEKLKASNLVTAALKGIRCGVIGMIAAAAYVVINSAEQSFISAAIFIITLVALLRLKIEAAWIIPTAGTMGYFLY